MVKNNRVTCTGCSLLCDDIIIQEIDKSQNLIIGACLKGKEKFNQIFSKNRILKPKIRRDNKLEEINWDNALENVIQLIQKSSKPILYGFSNVSCETQLKAIKLAKKINGFLDSNSTICQGKALNIAKEVGLNMTTLTDIINKSDVIILWGLNAVESIPRLLSKILFSRGKFRMTGREIKTLIIIDIFKTTSFNVLGTRDLAILVKPDKDIELIRFLKKSCEDKIEIPSNGISGVDKDDLKRLITYLLNSENIVILSGQGLLKSQEEGEPLKELIELTKIINRNNKNGRISLCSVGGHYNMVGFEHIALTYTGKNQSIQFKDGNIIQSNKNIITKIKEKDFDLSIIVGTDAVSHFPIEISNILTSKP
ncbi:MAG: molybdopterin-dependent oxidoreductase, partial [Candidatus Lokiarchaeota archaeon]|nr:molybdopterin-dependent oxidoreductase [Candidatus Lokiarchaeota archaeon]